MAIDEILLEVESKMETGLDYLRIEFRGIRTGRASAGLVDHIKVDYFGSPTDLRQLATITTPEPSLIMVKPFDPGSLKEIEKTIQASDLGITPNSDGKVIRLSVPSLSTERRQLLVTQIKKMAEAAKVTVRNARRDANKEMDVQEKASELTEDDVHKGKDDVLKLIHDYEKKIDDFLKSKVKEIEEI